jgi:putative MATE family efflux protein
LSHAGPPIEVRDESAEPAPPPPAPDVIHGAVWRQVLTLAWPTLIQQFLILLVGLWDQYLAGNLDPPPGVENKILQNSLTTANYVAWFLSSSMVLVSVGATALVARAVGAGDRQLAVRAAHQAFLLAVGLGLAGSLLGLTSVELLVHAVQLRGPNAEHAVDFLTPMFLLLAFQAVEAVGVACLAGAGDTRTGLLVLGGMAILNLPLSFGFSAGLGLGFPGIAWGTALSHVCGAVAVVALLARGRSGLRLDWRHFRPDAGLMWRMLRVSIPAGVDSLSVVAGQFWFLSIVNSLRDDNAGAAHGIALRWEALGYLSGTAFGTAAMTLVGQHLGARRPDLAARSGWTAFGLGCATMTLMGGVFFALARPMFRLFCPRPDQAGIVEAGVPVLQLVALAQPALAGCIVFTASLRGAGDTRMPVLFTWIGFLCVRIPLAYFLALPEVHLGPLGAFRGAGLGLYGAWLAMFVDLFVRGAFFLARFAGGRWKSARV